MRGTEGLSCFSRGRGRGTGVRVGEGCSGHLAV